MGAWDPINCKFYEILEYSCPIMACPIIHGTILKEFSGFVDNFCGSFVFNLLNTCRSYEVFTSGVYFPQIFMGNC